MRYDQEQKFLLPKSAKDWIEEDSLKQFISDNIDNLNQENRLKLFYPEPKTGEPEKACHPPSHDAENPDLWIQPRHPHLPQTRPIT